MTVCVDVDGALSPSLGAAKSCQDYIVNTEAALPC